MVQQPKVIDWARQHPLLQFVDLSDVQIEESLALRPLDGVQSLIDSDGSSLMSVIDEPSLRVVTLGFESYALRLALAGGVSGVDQ